VSEGKEGDQGSRAPPVSSRNHMYSLKDEPSQVNARDDYKKQLPWRCTSDSLYSRISVLDPTIPLSMLNRSRTGLADTT
jgi:hypothetical protein